MSQPEGVPMQDALDVMKTRLLQEFERGLMLEALLASKEKEIKALRAQLSE